MWSPYSMVDFVVDFFSNTAVVAPPELIPNGVPDERGARALDWVIYIYCAVYPAGAAVSLFSSLAIA